VFPSALLADTAPRENDFIVAGMSTRPILHSGNDGRMRMYFADFGYRRTDRFLRDSNALQFKDFGQEQVNLRDHHSLSVKSMRGGSLARCDTFRRANRAVTSRTRHINTATQVNSFHHNENKNARLTKVCIESYCNAFDAGTKNNIPAFKLLRGNNSSRALSLPRH
jgi:hypothetical protein